jgi:hypothetical protein
MRHGLIITATAVAFFLSDCTAQTTKAVSLRLLRLIALITTGDLADQTVLLPRVFGLMPILQNTSGGIRPRMQWLSQSFAVSCNGYAWYKNGIVPEQPGLKHNFLSSS